MAKITDLTNIPVVASGDLFAVADVSAPTTDVNMTVAQLMAFVNTANVFAAGNASANTWPKFTAGTLLTTPEDGAIEFDADCFYATTDAGNRGVVSVQHFIRADSTRTLANQTAAQAIFNSPTNGTLTLETGFYEFEGMIAVSGMSATSGNAQILFGGTGTFGAWLWCTLGVDGATAAVAARNGATIITNASPASAVTAGTSTAMQVEFKGTFECTVAGTWIPQIALVTAIGTAVIAIGSLVKIKRLGSISVVSVGQWT
jgi:hypothetical protein